MKEFITYLNSKVEEGKAETASLQADGRTDDANFAKARTNIYDICRTGQYQRYCRGGNEACSAG